MCGLHIFRVCFYENCVVYTHETSHGTCVVYTHMSSHLLEPYILSKEPYNLSKEPYILSKEPYNLSEEITGLFS